MFRQDFVAREEPGRQYPLRSGFARGKKKGG